MQTERALQPGLLSPRNPINRAPTQRRRPHERGKEAQQARRHLISGSDALGVIFLIAAAMYFLVPADSLPTFFPGHETGLMRIRAKHGMLTGAIGVVLLGVSWFLGRR